MTVMDYIYDRAGIITVRSAGVLAAAVFLLLTGTQAGIVIILLSAWLLFFLAGEAAGFLRTKAYLEELTAVMDGLDQRYLFAECAPRPRNLRERKLFDLLRQSGKAMIEAVSDARAAQREYREYIEQWVHEIKTPVTAARLICQNAEGAVRRKLVPELDRIDARVEQVLFYARAESTEKDFMIRRTKLSDICEEAIRNHRSLLIQNGIRVETEDLEQTVYTDSKWAVFMLGQLLQNAARYHAEEPVVTLSAQKQGQQVCLSVHDNGIGIPAHELPRVFDRGFTGSNGRSRGGSTGMGLYLCKRLAGALEIGVSIDGAQGEGTCVNLAFPAKDSIHKTDAANLTKL